MPRIVRNPSALACASALLLLLFMLSASVAHANRAKVDLRVIGKADKVLTEQSLVTGTTSIKTSPKATCFGKGTGGSGRSVKVKAGTALAALARASKSTAALRPLSITDHYLAEFGLGLCGIGRSKATSSLSWYLKVNHRAAQRGGEQTKVHAGDEVLWALEPYPYPDELALSAPSTAEAGKPFTVSVFSYDEKGKKKPAAGANVTGAVLPTDAEGHATVVLTEPAKLVASDGKDIPSNQVAVCLGASCPY
jgi:hypothetical protein